MSLNQIRPGLRAIKHDAISPSKVSLSIPPDDELFVSDDVADQLVAASRRFKDVDGESDEDEVEVVEQATAEPGEKRPARRKSAPRK